MTISLSSPVTGSAQAGFSSPSFTVAEDRAPEQNGKQWVVTAQSGAGAAERNLVSNPFSFTAVRPKQFKQLGQVNPVTGALANVPKNQWFFMTRKGMVPLVGQPPSLGMIRSIMDIPAGVETVSTDDIRAMISFHVGCLTQLSNALGGSAIDGTL